ncbi:MAG: hypothetical protein AAF617_18480, partial [Bacteroidota bacterium]
MKNYLLSIIVILTTYQSHAQVENTKDAILKNKVKTIVEKYCFTSSCSGVTKTYDLKGNNIEWDMYRIGSKYQYLYDQKNRKIAELRVDKDHGEETDTIF